MDNKCDKCYYKRECKLCYKEITRDECYQNFAFKCGRCFIDGICGLCIENCSKCYKNVCKKCDLINVCLECDKKECGKCCNVQKCRACKSFHHCNKCLKMNDGNCVGCYLKRFEEKDKIKWEYIDPNNPQLPPGTVICTNNIEAGIENGKMTHVWIGKIQKKKLGKDYNEKYKIYCLTKCDYYGTGLVESIDYWSKVPNGVKFEHTGDKIENLRVFGGALHGYYSVIL